VEHGLIRYSPHHVEVYILINTVAKIKHLYHQVII